MIPKKLNKIVKTRKMMEKKKVVLATLATAAELYGKLLNIYTTTYDKFSKAQIKKKFLIYI